MSKYHIKRRKHTLLNRLNGITKEIKTQEIKTKEIKAKEIKAKEIKTIELIFHKIKLLIVISPTS